MKRHIPVGQDGYVTLEDESAERPAMWWPIKLSVLAVVVAVCSWFVLRQVGAVVSELHAVGVCHP